MVVKWCWWGFSCFDDVFCNKIFDMQVSEMSGDIFTLAPKEEIYILKIYIFLLRNKLKLYVDY